jgi:hypothetical protein
MTWEIGAMHCARVEAYCFRDSGALAVRQQVVVCVMKFETARMATVQGSIAFPMTTQAFRDKMVSCTTHIRSNQPNSTINRRPETSSTLSWVSGRCSLCASCFNNRNVSEKWEFAASSSRCALRLSLIDTGRCQDVYLSSVPSHIKVRKAKR